MTAFSGGGGSEFVNRVRETRRTDIRERIWRRLRGTVQNYYGTLMLYLSD